MIVTQSHTLSRTDTCLHACFCGCVCTWACACACMCADVCLLSHSLGEVALQCRHVSHAAPDVAGDLVSNLRRRGRRRGVRQQQQQQQQTRQPGSRANVWLHMRVCLCRNVSGPVSAVCCSPCWQQCALQGKLSKSCCCCLPVSPLHSALPPQPHPPLYAAGPHTPTSSSCRP